MKTFCLTLVVVVFLSACPGRSKCPTIGPVGTIKAAPANPITGPYTRAGAQSQVDIADFQLNDPARKRAVPVRAYIPRGDQPAPVIIFSHGLGSSRSGYAYLGKAWSRAGYISLHIDHVDSDSQLALWRLYLATFRPNVWRNRPLDVTFLIDALEKHNPLLERVWRRADVSRIGVGGHSFGAYTALQIAGVMTKFKRNAPTVSTADPRADALVDLSPPYISNDPAAFAPVHIPALHMTGTNDQSPAFDTLNCHKRVPFDWIPSTPQYLVTMEGAVHRSFAGEKEGGGPNIEKYHAQIIQVTTAFWDATLRNDARAKDWLDRAAPERATVERK